MTSVATPANLLLESGVCNAVPSWHQLHIFSWESWEPCDQYHIAVDAAMRHLRCPCTYLFRLYTKHVLFLLELAAFLDRLERV
jgi:hypothetical protein